MHEDDPPWSKVHIDGRVKMILSPFSKLLTNGLMVSVNVPVAPAVLNCEDNDFVVDPRNDRVIAGKVNVLE